MSCFLINSTIQGQTTYFNNLYDNTYNFYNNGNNVIIKDGKYMIIGNGSSSCDPCCDSSSTDLFSIDTSGNVEWIKIYNYKSASEYVLFQSSIFIETPDNGYAVFTTLWYCIEPSGYTTTLTKLNVNGDSLWNKVIGAEILNVKLTYDSGFIAIGSNFYKEDITSTSDFYLAKLDSLGNILWANTYGDSINLEGAASVEFTDDGGYILFGITTDPDVINRDIYIVKVDSIGNEQWNKKIITSDDVQILGSTKTMDGNYLVYGRHGGF